MRLTRIYPPLFGFLVSTALGQELQPAARIPPVLLTQGHQRLCKVGVGDAFPAIELPQLEGEPAQLRSLAGKKSTIVLFWSASGWMSRAALRDFSRDLAGAAQADGTRIIGIAVSEERGVVQAALDKSGARFPQLLDHEAKAFAQVGSEALPRTYVLDPQGKIVWFDIEYSEATRRELRQTLRALNVADAASVGSR